MSPNLDAVFFSLNDLLFIIMQIISLIKILILIKSLKVRIKLWVHLN